MRIQLFLTVVGRIRRGLGRQVALAVAASLALCPGAAFGQTGKAAAAAIAAVPGSEAHLQKPMSNAFFNYSTYGLQGAIGAVGQGLIWSGGLVPGWQEAWRTLPHTMNPHLLQNRTLGNAITINSIANSIATGGSVPSALASMFGRQPQMPGNSFNSDFGGYNSSSSYAFQAYDSAMSLANLALGFNGSTSPVNFSTYLMQVGGLFNPLSQAGGFGGRFNGGFSFARVPATDGSGAAALTAVAADATVSSELAVRYEALGRQQVAAYYNDATLASLRGELNAVVYAIAYLDPQLIYWSEKLGVTTRQIYATRPTYAAAVALQQQVASWTNPPNDPAILRARYNTRILLMFANAQVQAEVLEYLNANPQVAQWISQVVTFIESRYALRSGRADVAQWYAAWQMRFTAALAASPAFQSYLEGLSEFLADFPEFAEYRQLQAEVEELLPALGSERAVQQLVAVSQAIMGDQALAAQLKSLQEQYLTTVNAALASTVFAAEQERYYEALAGLILADGTHQQIAAIQAVAVESLASYRRTVHDAVQRCYDLLGTACNPDRDAAVQAILARPDTATLLTAVGLFYEVDNVFWHRFYTGARYAALEATTRQRVSVALEPVLTTLQRAAEAYTAGVNAIVRVQQLRAVQSATVAALRSASAALNQRLTRMEQIIQALAVGPSMVLDRTTLRFAAVTDGVSFLVHTPPQVIRLTQAGSGTVRWTATSNQPWLTVSPSSGVGSAILSVGVTAMTGLPAGGAFTGTIALTFSGTTSTAGPVTVGLRTLANGTTTKPFGLIDTPVNNSRGVTGAVPFTGWALDDIGVESVTVCRAPVNREQASMDARCGGAAQIFIGDAVFVDGARPDVQAAFQTHPHSNRAGWGFMVLTNMLPDTGRGLPTGGNGTFVFHIYAREREGRVTLLGTRTMTCANAQATRPFGTIDTPAQGAVISGSRYVNFGWALTPNPKSIPLDGSTITAFIDGVAVGPVSYNHLRSDIAGFFPGLANTNGAVGFHVIDTTALSNGIHTIAWSVRDDAGSVVGIGSRFFTVSNGVAASGAARWRAASDGSSRRESRTVSNESPMTARSLMMASRQAPAVSGVGSLDDVDALPLDRSAIRGRRGWDLQAPWRGYLVGGAGHAIVRGEELDRFELDLDETGSQEYYGYLRAGTELTALPIGSHVDQTEGRFTWTPGVGFVGAYDLVFVRAIGGQAIARQEIRIILAAKGSGRLGPQVVIDTPGQKGAAPSRAAKGATGFGPIVVEQPFMLAGWATDLDAETGTGIDTLHVWAYPATGAPPVFLGVADQGGSRRDVAALHGEQFRDSAYGMLVQGLRSGDYDLAVFAWSNVTGGFVPAQIVRVRVP